MMKNYGGRKTVLCVALAAMAIAAVATAADATAADERKPVPPMAKHVVMIGVDGMGARWIPWDRMPNLSRLRDEGAYAVGRCHRPTASAINWRTVFSGLPPEVHGYRHWNSVKPDMEPPASALDAGGRLPCVFGEIRRQDPDARTVTLYSWPGVGFCHDKDAATVARCYGDKIDDPVVEEAIVQTGTAPKFMFVYQELVDAAGHRHGWGSTNQVAACEKLDADLGRILDALRATPEWNDTAVVVVADHGGLEKKHGGVEDIRVFEVPFIVGGPAAKGLRVREPFMLEDVAPTVLSLLGYAVPPAMRGRSALVADVRAASSTVDPAARTHEYFHTYAPSPLFAENTFVGERAEDAPLPDADAWRSAVPRAVWDGHPDAVAAFAASWRMVGEKIHRPENGTNFKRNFVYTPFGNSVFVWGSCFITMFGQYAENVFPFISQLDNFYAAQEPDGFIPRQLGIYDGRSQFERSDLSSVGGNIFAWAELERYRFTGDADRLRRVHPVLLAYHEWIRRNRTWKDGTYYSSGWGCGMDNVPRFGAARYSPEFHHGFISWVDATLQQVLDAKCILEIEDAAGLTRDAELEAESEALTRLANERMWREDTGLYHDLGRDGAPTGVRHVGAFWALVAGVAPPERARRLALALEDPATFAAPCGTRSLAKGEAGYEPDGGNYWRGGVWCITDWMAVRGLAACGMADEAHRLARRQVEAVAKVYADTGTIWESYDPEKLAPGKLYGQPVRRDFVGFSGVAPVAMLIRDVFGMEFAPGRIRWKVRLLERHGVENLTLPDGNVVSLVCERRGSTDDPPIVKVESSRPVEVAVE